MMCFIVYLRYNVMMCVYNYWIVELFIYVEKLLVLGSLSFNRSYNIFTNNYIDHMLK